MLLVPFLPAPNNIYEPGLREAMVQERRMLEQLASRFGAAFAPYPVETISPQNWGDPYCHTNAAGSLEKARYLAPFAPVRSRSFRCNSMLAGVNTKDGPQASNPDEMVVIVFGVELRAIDQAHRDLKSFMEGRRTPP